MANTLNPIEFERFEAEEPEILYCDWPGCDGDGEPMGHPMVYLTMGGGGETVCPYCSRRFVLAEGPNPSANL